MGKLSLHEKEDSTLLYVEAVRELEERIASSRYERGTEALSKQIETAREDTRKGSLYAHTKQNHTEGAVVCRNADWQLLMNHRTFQKSFKAANNENEVRNLRL
jgi:hypothetical protein